MQHEYSDVATPFLPGRVNEFPQFGYDCSCNTPSTYRIALGDSNRATIFSLCPKCDNIRNGGHAVPWEMYNDDFTLPENFEEDL